MLFCQFASQEERRAAGGSAFIELQYCRLPQNTPLKRILSVEKLTHWQLDSLYVADEEAFARAYASLFADALHADGHTGEPDLYGINYYPPQRVEELEQEIRRVQPTQAALLLNWLQGATNGIYILGI